MPRRKPRLTVGEQIEYLKSRGITFDLRSEHNAAVYLEHANNYITIHMENLQAL